MPPNPPVVLFGYHSSTFTKKIQVVLRLRQIPYTFVLVPSMMPRPALVSAFNLTYRKIPVLAIGRDVYVDTSLIAEALHAHPAFQDTTLHPSLHGNARERALSRIWASHFTDRPLFRLMTGLIPATVWRTSFGTDRGNLIGHKLDPDKLERKIPRNLAGLDTALSVLEPTFAEDTEGWVLGTERPTLADVALWYQLDWGEKISRGEYVNDLTQKEAKDGSGEGMSKVFSKDRYPGLWAWFNHFRQYIDALPNTEKRVIGREDQEGLANIVKELDNYDRPSKDDVYMIPTPHGNLTPTMDNEIGLKVGTRVSIVPDDTGRGDPTYGTLIATSTEEVVIAPDVVDGVKAEIRNVRLHFPRVGFVIQPITKLSQETARAKL